MKDYIYMSGMKAGMILCLQGESTALINGKLYKIERGVLCFISPLISFYEMSKSDDFKTVEIMEDVEKLYSVFKKISDIIVNLRVWSFPCLHLDEEYIRLFMRRKSWIDFRYEEICNVSNKEEVILIENMFNLMIQETMLEFLRLFFKDLKVKPLPAKKNEEKVFRFISSLQRHYKMKRSVTFYARESCLSVGHFTRIVKEYTDKTPSEWISFITILNAKVLIEQSVLSIKDISRELNFPEQFTFRKYFKHYVGVSPTKYRIALKRKTISP